ncbi:MAG: PilN domain-containing protein [Aestuariivirga sp.]
MSNSATAYAVNRVSRGARWLKTCVSAFIDELAQKLDSREASRALVTVERDHADLHVRDRNGEARHVARVEGSLDSAAIRFREQLTSRQRQAVALRIGAGRALITTINLPQGIADVLPAVVRNKIESLGPWPLEETVWGYRVAGSPRDGQIGVDVALTSRSKLDELLRPLEAAGLRIGRIDAQDPEQGEHIVAFDFHDARRRVRLRRIASTAIAAMLIAPLITASLGGYRWYAAQNELTAVEARIASLESGLRGGDVTAGSAQLAQANQLYARKRDSEPFVTVLAKLSELLPDQVWLESLSFENGIVTITGRGSGVPALIETLESSQLFKAANFAAATQHDDAANIDTFSISANVESKGALK